MIKFLPAVREISLSVEELLHALLNLAPSRRVSILDSCGSRPPDARFLIAGFDPFEVVEAHNDEVRISRTREDKSIEVRRCDALAFLDERLEALHVPVQSEVPTAGACIASFSYDLARSFERLRTNAPLSSADEP